MNYQEFCMGKKITDVKLRKKYILDFDVINIIFSHEEKIQLFAIADCCSSSWFHFIDNNISDIIGRELMSIEILNQIDLPSETRSVCPNPVFVKNRIRPKTSVWYSRL